MDTQPTPSDLLTTIETAKLLGVHAHTIRRWVEDGQLPAYRLGKRIRISRADALAFLVPVEPVNRPRPMTRRERAARDAETDRVLRALKIRK